jgi:hypothetical protein
MCESAQLFKEVSMNGKWLYFGVAALALSSCAIPVDYDDDDDRPRERARSECTDEAHDQDYRRIEVQSVRAQGRNQWEVTMQARDRSGRDVRLRCEYDARNRRARVSRVDR